MKDGGDADERGTYSPIQRPTPFIFWVCGGCFGTPNTEGSQPLGMIRPVSVYGTGSVRIALHGVGIRVLHVKENQPVVRVCTKLINLENTQAAVTLKSVIISPEGRIVEELADAG